MSSIILASKSPRRQELIRYITRDVEVKTADVAEVLPDGISAEQAPVYLAALKADAVAALYPERTVIGADTVVVSDGRVLGKPADADDAYRMLRALSGRVHTVITGCCIIGGGHRLCFGEKTRVEFYPLSDREILDYIATGDPFDKAGAYGIQSGAMLFVKGIQGDFFNVMGLPVARLSRELRSLDGSLGK